VVLYEPLLEQQVAPTIKVLGLTSDAAESEVLYHPSDRFRRLTNWYEITTRQVLPNLRPNNANPRPR
jgi:peptide/nickel transport system substrate-binding protein